MYICDGHTHTYFSFDAEDSPDRMCAAAIKAGVDEIGITDHYDIDGIIEEIYPGYKADEAKIEIMQASEKYRSKLKVTYGIEIGQPHIYPHEARAFLNKYDFEYVIASLHNLRNVPDFAMFKYDMMNEKQIGILFDRMLDELCEMVQFDGISTVAHMTYMHRYLRLADRDLDFSKHLDKIRCFFRIIIEKGIALELNLSTLKKIGITMPAAEIMRIYHDLGGELVTVGSDAHKTENVGACIREGYRLLDGIGFKYVTTFRNKKPVQNKI